METIKAHYILFVTSQPVQPFGLHFGRMAACLAKIVRPNCWKVPGPAKQLPAAGLLPHLRPLSSRTAAQVLEANVLSVLCVQHCCIVHAARTLLVNGTR